MYYYGTQSKANLATVKKDLVIILYEAIKIIDISVICGHRSVEEQQKLFHADPPRTKIDGITKLSNHNYVPSKAVDIIPYKKGLDPFDPNPKNLARYYYMMGIIKAIAERLLKEGKITHKVRFGIDWDSDDVFTDQNFHDLPHMELQPI